jgi:hypothetical protein
VDHSNGEPHVDAETPAARLTWPSSTQSRPGFLKRHTRVSGFLRLLAIWLINTVALMALRWIVPEVHTPSCGQMSPCPAAMPGGIKQAHTAYVKTRVVPKRWRQTSRCRHPADHHQWLLDLPEEALTYE